MAEEANIAVYLIDFVTLEEQAESAFLIRNEIRTLDRFFMNDRIKAVRLAFEEKNIEWEKLVAKVKAKASSDGVGKPTEKEYLKKL